MTQPAQSERVMDSTQSADAWVEATFPMRCFYGHERPALTVYVKGWTRGQFGIDERENQTSGAERRRGRVWCITHLGTGYAARYVIGSLRTAQRLADEIAAVGDWNFTDPGQAKPLGAAVKRIMARNQGSFVSSSEAGPPVPAEHEVQS